jgi:hypothetical protein
MVAALAGDAPVLWRSCVAAVFFLVSPGLAVLAPARFRWEVELALLVPTSLAVTTVVSVALFFVGVWSPLTAVASLSACGAAGALGVAAGGATASPPARNPSAGASSDWADVT